MRIERIRQVGSPLAVALLMCLAIGCATPAFELRIKHMGAYDPVKNEASEKTARSLKWDREYQVKVYLNQIPKGFAYKGSVLSVKPAYQSRFKILAAISSGHAMSAQLSLCAVDLVVRHDARSAQSCARHLLQGADAAAAFDVGHLVFVFADQLALSDPLFTQRAHQPQAAHSRAQAAATAIGANLVIVSRQVNERQVSGGLYSVQSYRVGAARLSGFAVLDRGAKPAPAQPPPRAARTCEARLVKPAPAQP
jgi:hypothetical protein